MRNFVQVRGDFKMRTAEYLDVFEARNEKSTMKLDKRAISRQSLNDFRRVISAILIRFRKP